MSRNTLPLLSLGRWFSHCPLKRSYSLIPLIWVRVSLVTYMMNHPSLISIISDPLISSTPFSQTGASWYSLRSLNLFVIQSLAYLRISLVFPRSLTCLLITPSVSMDEMETSSMVTIWLNWRSNCVFILADTPKWPFVIHPWKHKPLICCFRYPLILFDCKTWDTHICPLVRRWCS